MELLQHHPQGVGDSLMSGSRFGPIARAARHGARIAGLLLLTIPLSVPLNGHADPAPAQSAAPIQLPSLTVIAPERAANPPSAPAIQHFVQSRAVPTHID
jgi:hypothetical protein